MTQMEDNADFEFGFNFKAKEVKFNSKGTSNVSLRSNQPLDTEQARYSKNLPEKFRENLVYYRVEKRSFLSLTVCSTPSNLHRAGRK